MNERYKELMAEAGFDPAAIERMGLMPQATEFTMLVIKDCLSIIEERRQEHAKDYNTPFEDTDFVDPVHYNENRQVRKACCHALNSTFVYTMEHFGIQDEDL